MCLEMRWRLVAVKWQADISAPRKSLILALKMATCLLLRDWLSTSRSVACVRTQKYHASQIQIAPKEVTVHAQRMACVMKSLGVMRKASQRFMRLQLLICRYGRVAAFSL